MEVAEPIDTLCLNTQLVLPSCQLLLVETRKLNLPIKPGLSEALSRYHFLHNIHWTALFTNPAHSEFGVCLAFCVCPAPLLMQTCAWFNSR
jgi:hypothetical protein